MNKLLAFFFVIIFFSNCQNENINKKDFDLQNIDFQQEFYIAKVLFSGIEDSVFVFKIKSDYSGYEKLEVIYLGEIQTVKHKRLGIIVSNYFFGIDSTSLRCNSKLQLFDLDIGKIGFYNIGNLDSAPNRIEKNSIVFEYKNENCESTTLISFENNIPSEIFIICQDERGDIYNFETKNYSFNNYSFLKYLIY